jgi:hypothetical protein
MAGVYGGNELASAAAAFHMAMKTMVSTGEVEVMNNFPLTYRSLRNALKTALWRVRKKNDLPVRAVTYGLISELRFMCGASAASQVAVVHRVGEDPWQPRIPAASLLAIAIPEQRFVLGDLDRGGRIA